MQRMGSEHGLRLLGYGVHAGYLCNATRGNSAVVDALKHVLHRQPKGLLNGGLAGLPLVHGSLVMQL